MSSLILLGVLVINHGTHTVEIDSKLYTEQSTLSVEFGDQGLTCNAAYAGCGKVFGQE